MELIKLYAKEVPAADGMTGKKDTLIANDLQFNDIKLRWPWHKKNRPVKRRFLTLNCYKWELVWVDKD